ncbi:hypothetical protein Ciccas_010914 [Cichlidogyrus casuarinus]|uniref:Uncharacterized protein n=1 Tax=Cichlidogyrus casuarinus TaxID=1844966 RepID=A0ABD2PXF0_9PLAT
MRPHFKFLLGISIFILMDIVWVLFAQITYAEEVQLEEELATHVPPYLTKKEFVRLSFENCTIHLIATYSYQVGSHRMDY